MYHSTDMLLRNCFYKASPAFDNSTIFQAGGTVFKTSNVTILVADMNRSIRFYTESLGLKLISNYGGQFAVIESNGLRIGLHPGKTGGEKLSRDLSIGF